MQIWNPSEADIFKTLHFSQKGLSKDGSKEVMVYNKIGVVKTKLIISLKGYGKEALRQTQEPCKPFLWNTQVYENKHINTPLQRRWWYTAPGAKVRQGKCFTDSAAQQSQAAGLRCPGNLKVTISCCHVKTTKLGTSQRLFLICLKILCQSLTNP